MKLRASKIGFVLLVLLFLATTANAQFVNNKHKKSRLVFAVGGGVSVVDFSRMNMLGGNIMVEARKPIYHFGKRTSLTLNLTLMTGLGNQAITGEKEKFVALPAGLLTLNINAFSQATRASKELLGGFLGAGILVMPSYSITYDKEGKSITEESGVVGPAVMMGPRFRIGKTFMGLRMFGGILFDGDKDLTYAGLNLMFTFGMNHSSSRFIMQ